MNDPDPASEIGGWMMVYIAMSAILSALILFLFGELCCVVRDIACNSAG